jgi:hypothetical protein
MAKRKTCEVKSLLEFANKQLARKDDEATKEFKSGVCLMIERALHDTGNYHGFNYNEWVNGGCDRWQRDGCPEEGKDAYLYSEHGGEFDRVYY